MEQGRSEQGSLERSGVAVYEVFTGQIDLGTDDAAAQYRQDPDVYMKRFLEGQGFEVNDIRPREAAGERPDPSPEGMECRWWHEVYPYRSNWEYACYHLP